MSSVPADGRWPQWQTESISWDDADREMPRAVRARHRGPYDAAVPPKIATVSVNLPSATSASAAEASNLLARFDTELGARAPFAAVLLRSESASSSQIEDLTSSAKAIATSELGRPGRPNADLIVGNVRAMQTAMALPSGISRSSILSMHSELLRAHTPAVAGRWRDQQVWIGGTTYGPHLAEYVAPHHRHVSGAMDDLVTFCQRTDIPALEHVAIAHAQFENVHPFTDGNGRAGRTLLHRMLRDGGITTNAPVPVSAGLLSDTDGYFDALVRYRAGDPVPIVEVIVDSAFRAVENGRRLVTEIQELRSSWRERVTARRGAAAWALLDLLIGQPVIDMPYARQQLGVTAANAQIAIDRLVDDGVLSQVGAGRRDRVWQAPEIIAALETFSARAVRGR